MRFLLLLALAWPVVAAGQDSEMQRAVVQRDQMTAEFAAQLKGAQNVRELQALHARQLSEIQLPAGGDAGAAQTLLPYQRTRMAEEARVLQFAPPVVRPAVPGTGLRPLALPGGARRGVDPISPEGLGR